MNYIEINAPAKINLGLNIVSKRDDGYHNLETLFYPLSEICDVLKFEKSKKFSFSCDNADIENPADNIVVKAVRLLELFTDSSLPMKIELTKNIPMGAGLGGGSSDAAATLISLNELFHLKICHSDLISLALKLGSDVPFFIKAKPAIGTSRGEKLEQVELEIFEPILVVNPGIHISTKDAFSGIIPKPCSIDYKSFITDGKLNYDNCNSNMTNDFEKSVFEKHSKISELKTLLNNCGAIYSQMSGSGSTVYGIFKTLKNAESAKAKLPNEYLRVINHT